jgi:hypothetical protein
MTIAMAMLFVLYSKEEDTSMLACLWNTIHSTVLPRIIEAVSSAYNWCMNITEVEDRQPVATSPLLLNNNSINA